MNFLDMRTVIFSHVIIDVVWAVVMAFLWSQNRKRFAGAAWWVLDFALQAAATILIILRGSIPDWMSLVVSNTLIMAGTLCGYLGLERFVGNVRSQVHNYALIVVFAGVHTYFSVGQPNLAARNFNISLGLLLLCGQCAWLMLLRVPPDLRPLTRGVGLVFSAYCLVSLVRIIEFFTGPHPVNDFFQSGAFETLILLAYQILLILLAYSLALMVNGRLIMEVRLQEEKFTTAFHCSPYAMMLTRLTDGKIFEVNAGFVELSGYQADEVLGKTTPELHLWANEDDRRQVVQTLAQQQRIHEQEGRFRKKSGELFTGVFSAEMLILNNQPCMLSSINDISERRRAETTIRALAKFPDENPNPILRITRAGRVLYANQRSADLLQAWHCAVGQRLPDRWRQVVLETLDAGVDRKEEAVCGARVFALTFTPIMTDDYVNIYGSDITDHKQAEETLQISEMRYRRLFEAAQDGILILDADTGQVIDANPFMQNLLGYSGAEFIGKNLWDIGLFKDIAASKDAFDELQRQGYIRYEDLPLETSDGGRIHVEFVSNVYLVDRKYVIQCNIRDITARKRAEAERERLNLELTRKNTELEQLVYVTSHDLRSPLVNVQGFSKELEHALRDLITLLQSADVPAHARATAAGIMDNDIQVDLRYILSSVAKMDALLTGLLKLSRLGRAALSITSLDMNSLMAAMLATFEFRIQQAGVKLEVAELPACQGDLMQLNQIFSNLLDNALKYLDTTRPGVINIGGSLKDDHAIYYVADNGIGIAPEHQPKIFEIFQRLNPTIGTGEGLGLVIVRKSLERQGGKVWVESEPGKGSKFYVSLPRG